MSKKTFSQTVEALRYGTLHDDLTDSINQLTEAVTRTANR